MGQKRESPSTVELIRQPLCWPFRRNSYHNWTCLKSGWEDRNEREGPRGRNTSARKNVQDSASVWTAASSQKRQALWEMGTLAKGGLQRKMRLWEKRFCNNIRSFFFNPWTNTQPCPKDVTLQTPRASWSLWTIFSNYFYSHLDGTFLCRVCIFSTAAWIFSHIL